MKKEQQEPVEVKAPDEPKIERFYTLPELAKLFRSKNVQVINRMNRQKRFKSVKFGGRYLVAESEVKYILKHGLRPIADAWTERSRLEQRAHRAKVKAAAAIRIEAKTTGTTKTTGNTGTKSGRGGRYRE